MITMISWSLTLLLLVSVSVAGTLTACKGDGSRLKSLTSAESKTKEAQDLATPIELGKEYEATFAGKEEGETVYLMIEGTSNVPIVLTVTPENDLELLGFVLDANVQPLDSQKDFSAKPMVLAFSPRFDGVQGIMIIGNGKKGNVSIISSYLAGSPEERVIEHSIEIGNKVTGTLAGGAYDDYTFEAFQHTAVLFKLEADDALDSLLELYDPEGNLVEDTEQRFFSSHNFIDEFFASFRIAGIWKLRVVGRGDPSNYTLMTSYPIGTPEERAARTIQLGETLELSTVRGRWESIKFEAKKSSPVVYKVAGDGDVAFRVSILNASGDTLQQGSEGSSSVTEEFVPPGDGIYQLGILPGPNDQQKIYTYTVSLTEQQSNEQENNGQVELESLLPNTPITKRITQGTFQQFNFDVSPSGMLPSITLKVQPGLTIEWKIFNQAEQEVGSGGGFFSSVIDLNSLPIERDQGPYRLELKGTLGSGNCTVTLLGN
jgi:hypothetical protein